MKKLQKKVTKILKKLQKSYQNFEKVAKKVIKILKNLQNCYQIFEKVAKKRYLNFNYSCKNQYLSFRDLIISKSSFLALFSYENFEKSYIKVT